MDEYKSEGKNLGSKEPWFDKWFSNWFEPILHKIDITIISWEELLDTIRGNDPQAAEFLQSFYGQCKRFCQLQNHTEATGSE